jgi:uncharacterized membrane protein YedE/YeeE
MNDRSPSLHLAVLAVVVLFGFGLGSSHMAQPEVVLDFLQLEDLGLLFVMGAAVVVTSVTFFVGTKFLGDAPLTGAQYTRRLKSFDTNVLTGGAIFGVGWGLSGICPGAAYASVGIGNLPILWGIAGMFLGAYAQGFWRTARAADSADTPASAD